MKELLVIAISSAFVSNVVLSQFLGICSFVGVSKKVETAAGMGGAVIFVITIASVVASLIYQFVLDPLGLDYLKTIVFILVIAALVQIVEMFLKKCMVSLYNALGVFLPLITTNCAVLGVALTNVQNSYNFAQSVVNGVATAIGYTVSIVLLAGIRERIEGNDIPYNFQGSPIVLVTAGLMAIAFFGFSGLLSKEETKMNMTAILIAAAVIAVAGLIVGIGLGLFGEKFKVEVDEKEVAIREELPGNNCGGCGFAGCDALAKAIAEGKAPANACPVGGAPVGEKIAAILGVSAGAAEKKVAFVRCKGSCDKVKTLYNYDGIDDCAKASVVPAGGPKACSYGCTGFGSCVKACQFDAIHVVDGVAVVDKEKCVACGKCVATCPKGLIQIVPYNAEHLVQCSSHDKGKDVKAACQAGCIGCTLCTKQCESDAIHMDNNLAVIDYEKCTNCGKCAEKCPVKVIL